MAALGKLSGFGAKTSVLFNKEDRRNDATITLLPSQVRAAYVVYGSSQKS